MRGRTALRRKALLTMAIEHEDYPSECYPYSYNVSWKRNLPEPESLDVAVNATTAHLFKFEQGLTPRRCDNSRPFSRPAFSVAYLAVSPTVGHAPQSPKTQNVIKVDEAEDGKSGSGPVTAAERNARYRKI